jgi:hemoglobin-like flavoprotein
MDLSEQFDHSFKRVISDNQIVYFTVFYQHFTDQSESIKKAFEHTDMEKQKQMMHDSLLHIIAYSLNSKVSEPLELLAKLHARLNISSDFYDLWLESLIHSAYQTDQLFSAEDEQNWRLIFSPGITLMKSFCS